MLKKLIVKNFALIDDLEIEFYHGLNVLTGETGSGKSILMESLNLLFGARADSCFIRDNTKSAVVSACFELDDNTSLYFNNKKEITIFREIDNKNGNIIKLDNESISLNKLREYSRYLGSFFSQDDSHIALDNDNLISYIDKMDYANQNAIINDYLLTRNDYYNLKKKYESLLEKKNITLSYEEKYKEQLKELTAFNVTIDEDISLKELILKISHLDKIKSSLLEVSSICDNEYFSIDNLYNCHKILAKISSYDIKYKNLEDKFSTSYYELSDCFTNLKKEIDELDFDSSYLDKLNNRLSDLQKLEKKYGMSNNELVAYKEKIKEELGLAINYDNYIKEAYALVDAKYNKLLRIGNTLTKNRKLLADKLCKMIINDANFLNLENISIKMDFLTNQKVEFKDNGIDNVSFLVSFNEGEPLKPFVKVSSGGEKSRIFMILQFIITKLNNQSTLVLDEIDTGVSGRTSGLIAKMMQQNSASIQLIVITHSVIVAGVASNHYKISKIKNGSHITTTIKLLDISQRIIELAYMLSPEEITDSAISQAKTILGIS